MSFTDHIDHFIPDAFDFAAANRCLAIMAAQMISILDIARVTFDYRPLIEWASCYRRIVRGLIREASQAYRFELKMAMLNTPAWRLRVMKDLGGLQAFINWQKRRKTGPKLKRHITPLTEEERAHRAHIRTAAKRAANPLITEDPFKVDFEGQFRLAPLPRFAREGGRFRPNQDEGISAPDYEYDGTQKTDMRGLNAPISVWPEEFLMFAEREAEALGQVGPKVSDWLKAIAERAEKERETGRLQRSLDYAPP